MKIFLVTILALSAIFNSAKGDESEITKQMKKFKIIPDVISGNIPALVNVTFDSGFSVDMGNLILPSQAKNQPKVSWNTQENTYYTLICFDADAPSPSDPSLSPLITWMVGNIPGDNINSGEVLAEYFAVSPPRGKMQHRAIFMIMKQPRKQIFEEKYIDDRTLDGRTNFSLNDFSQKYELVAEGGNFYLTEFDSYVMKVFEKLNCCFQYNEPEE